MVRGNPSLDLGLELLGFFEKLLRFGVAHDVRNVVIERVPLPAA